MPTASACSPWQHDQPAARAMSLSSSSRPTPLAGGQPISDAVADQAAGWLTLLMSGEATDHDRMRLQQWRDAHADHERAWKHIETVTGRFRLMEPDAAYKVLSPLNGPKALARRKALNLLLWGGAIGGAWVLTSRTRTWQTAIADYRTATGEQRTVSLSDGTRILLNTASAIDVRYDGQRRLVRLVAGEVMIVTGHREATGGIDRRPFVVATDEGHIRALGTRFTVRQDDGRTAVAVLQSAVEIRPNDTSDVLVLREGERTTFSRRAIDAALPSPDRDAAWTRGQIVADNVRLGDFLADLSRYRPGIVRCEPDAANLRFSGVFPLDDTDRILQTLPTVLPVEVVLRSRYWVTVKATS
ncbi:FecR domain-containing protein [Paraburkholderia sp.]|uniref:FecR domain-containing protein n=1 Tax=Paraburkholderia sp. TaxID=1926495 RepID=UPI0039E71140